MKLISHTNNNDCIQHLYYTVEGLKEKLEAIEKKVRNGKVLT